MSAEHPAASTWPVCPSCGTEAEEVVTQPGRDKRLDCPSCGWRSDAKTVELSIFDLDAYRRSVLLGAAEVLRREVEKDTSRSQNHRADVRAYPSEALDEIVAFAKGEHDGCVAISSEYQKSKPTAVVLVATAANLERVALLHALHEAWYPRGDDA